MRGVACVPVTHVQSPGSAGSGINGLVNVRDGWRATEVRATEVRANEVRATEVRVTEVRVTEVRACSAASCAVSVAAVPVMMSVTVMCPSSDGRKFALIANTSQVVFAKIAKHAIAGAGGAT